MLHGLLNTGRTICLTLLCFIATGTALVAQSPGQSPAESNQDPLERPRSRKKADAKKGESSYRRWLDEDVAYIILPEERDAFMKLTNDSERATFIEIFWDKRNPNPGASENEYKEEYYRRIAFANERFSAGMPGWKTDRGRIYILHGPPDSIESHPAGGPYTRPADQGGGQTVTHPFEIWHYRHIDGLHEDVNIEFVDACGCGAYELTIDPSLKDVLLHVPNAGPTDLEALGLSKKTDRLRGAGPSLFGSRPGKEFDDIADVAILNAPPPVKPRTTREEVRSIMRTNLLPFDVRVDFVKGDNNTVLTPITIQVPNRDVAYVVKDGVQRAALNFSGTVTNLTGRIIATFDAPLRLDIPADLLEKFAGNASLYQEVLWLRPGHYRLDVMLKDMNGDKLGIFAHSIEVPDFSDTDKLATSTLILADLMDPAPPREIGSGAFVLGASKVRPRVAPANGEPATFARGQRVNVWMQVYHLSIDQKTQRPSARIEYNVVNLATGMPVFNLVQTTNEIGVAGQELTLQQHVPADNLGPGDYEVTIKVDDRVTQKSLAAKARFVVK
jgi:GWxTD domain-containing protein